MLGDASKHVLAKCSLDHTCDCYHVKSCRQRAMQYYWTHGLLLDNMFVALVCCWRRHVMSSFMYDVVFFIQLSVDWCKV